MIESTLIALMLQIIVALTILNVWFVRASHQTKFRGASARSLSEEFQEYGLSRKIYLITSIVKPMLAVSLIIAIFFPFLTKPASLALATFMLGALYMHFKVRDEVTKYLPAFSMFCGCVAIFLLS
tara:strand:+ start:814 stop:1188 length:375 start_codon:yes stop_codon:yes gene_type:complete